MGRRRKQRRQAQDSGWHWKQTDCQYYTPPGCKRRVGLLDERANVFAVSRIAAAEQTLARAKLALRGWRMASANSK